MSQGADPLGSSGEDVPPQPAETAETVYRARRDPTAPVGNQIEVTVDA